MNDLFDKGVATATAILVAAVLVAILVAKDFSGALPALPRFEPQYVADALGPADPRLSGLFAAGTLTNLPLAPNVPVPFATKFFQPPPPPQPPPTRKVSLTYQGFIETSPGDKRAYVLVGPGLVVGPAGTRLVSDVTIAQIHLAELTLMRGGTQAVTVPFRGTTEIEVPAE